MQKPVKISDSGTLFAIYAPKPKYVSPGKNLTLDIKLIVEILFAAVVILPRLQTFYLKLENTLYSIEGGKKGHSKIYFIKVGA